ERPAIGPAGPGITSDQERRQQGFGDRPSQDSVSQFERMLDQQEEEAPQASEQAAWQMGDAMLRGMGAVPRGDDAARGGMSETAARLVDEIASRVLVSQAGAPSEIRIAVKDSVFPGLEIRVAQTPSGLVVELLAASSADVAVLRAEAGRLLERLKQRTG